jgi:hypothetical protein
MGFQCKKRGEEAVRLPKNASQKSPPQKSNTYFALGNESFF